MDYNKLIALAQTKAQNASNSIIKKPIAKSSGPDPKAIESFLIKKRLNEFKREEEERAKREKLLYLRSQNSKSNKKAKLMANRTKDNDYSKIVLTDRDIQNKERVDSELRKKGIGDKLDRMKQRIELEEKDDDLPITRKRKKKIECYSDKVDDYNYNYNYERQKKEREELFKKSNSLSTNQNNSSSKQLKQPPSFEELLRLANQQKEKRKTLEEEIEEELLSKKMKNEKEELKKKAELYQKSLTSKRKGVGSTISTKNEPSTKKDIYNNYREINNNHNGNNSHLNKSKSIYSSTTASQSKKDLVSNYKLNHKSSDNSKPINKPIPKLTNNKPQNGIESILNSEPTSLASKIASLSKEQLLELSNAVNKVKKVKKNDEYSSRPYSEYKSTNKSNNYQTIQRNPNPDEYDPVHNYKQQKSTYRSTNESNYSSSNRLKNDHNLDEYDPVNNYKSNINGKSNDSNKKSSQRRLIDIDSLTEEEIEKIRKERLEKQRIEQLKSNKLSTSSSQQKSTISHSNKPSINSKYSIDKDKSPIRSSSSKQLNSNRYLPPIGATYQRGMYDSSYYDNYDDEDYEDEEDDEMKDFIDDAEEEEGIPESMREEIDKIFRYNRNKYASGRFDESDIEETSYAQQMMEERRSSRIGYLEDLEEERKESEERKRKAKLKKKGIRISSDEDED